MKSLHSRYFAKVHLLRSTNVSEKSVKEGKSIMFFVLFCFVFFNLQYRSFLIGCYVIYPGPNLEKKGNTQALQKYRFSL